MKVALVSLNQIWEDKEKNLLLCKGYVKKAMQNNVDLIVFPEMTLTGFSMDIESHAESESDSGAISSFQSLAKEYCIAIHFGVAIKDGNKARNNSYFLDKQGNIISMYSKIHPFSFAGENRFYNSGSELSTVNFKGYKIGLTICYDLRFPELYSALARECDVIVNIANWPKRRVDHWNTLLKARAIENQIFVIGVNRVGVDGNGLKYERSSQIFNANGEKLFGSRKKDMETFRIKKSWTEEFKDFFLTVEDRRNDFYKENL